MDRLFSILAGRRGWIAYTATAALLGAFLLYQQHGSGMAQRHFDIGVSYMGLIHESEAKERAVRHLLIAGEQGHIGAQRTLGQIHLKDFVRDRRQEDFEHAQRWLEMAAGQDDAEASRSLDHLLATEQTALPKE